MTAVPDTWSPENGPYRCASGQQYIMSLRGFAALVLTGQKFDIMDEICVQISENLLARFVTH